MERFKKYLDEQLVDDNTLTGGTSHKGETLSEFLADTPYSELTYDLVNRKLIRCGILPLYDKAYNSEVSFGFMDVLTIRGDILKFDPKEIEKHGYTEMLFDKLGEYDIVSASEIEIGYIASDGFVYNLDDTAIASLSRGERVHLGVLGFVKDMADQDFIDWYEGNVK